MRRRLQSGRRDLRSRPGPGQQTWWPWWRGPVWGSRRCHESSPLARALPHGASLTSLSCLVSHVQLPPRPAGPGLVPHFLIPCMSLEGLPRARGQAARHRKISKSILLRSLRPSRQGHRLNARCLQGESEPRREGRQDRARLTPPLSLLFPLTLQKLKAWEPLAQGSCIPFPLASNPFPSIGSLQPVSSPDTSLQLPAPNPFLAPTGREDPATRPAPPSAALWGLASASYSLSHFFFLLLLDRQP